MNLALVIGGMALATYLPRLAPFYLVATGMPPWLRRFFALLPAAALGALVFPGALDALPGRPAAAAAALVAAGATAALGRGLVLPVAVSIGVAWIALGL